MYSLKFINHAPSKRGLKLVENATNFLADNANLKLKDDLIFDSIISSPNTELEHIKNYANIKGQLENFFTDMLIISVGGASLTPQAFFSIPSSSAVMKIHFLDNLDENYVENLLATIDLRQTIVITISNSGRTSETFALSGAVYRAFIKRKIENISRHFLFILGDASSLLANFAEQIKAINVPYPKNLGGKFCAFSSVTILPALIAGFQVDAYLTGAAEAMSDFMKNKINSLAAYAGLFFISSRRNVKVSFSYHSILQKFIEWRYLISAEILGKNNSSLVPVNCFGANSQHTIMQLLLSGRKDKAFTFFNLGATENLAYDNHPNNMLPEKDLQYINLNSLMQSHIAANIESLKAIKAPISIFNIQKFCHKNLGKLMANTLLENIIIAKCVGINPYSQPEIERLKRSSLICPQALLSN